MLEAMRAEDERMEAEMASGPSSFEIPLFCAAESGSVECVDALLAAGANLRARESSGETAIFSSGSAAVARRLVDAGLNIEEPSSNGWTPLVHAVSDGDINRVRALVSAGANVNGVHDHGYTVFMSAVGSGRTPEILRYLVESGADPHALSGYGYNAFHAAIDVNFEANAPESVRGTLSYLKQLGVNIEHKNNSGKTPLARAIEEGTGLEVQVLCELGANPNNPASYYHQCDDGPCTHGDLTPLLAAIDCGVEADVKVEAILRAGADPLAVNAKGHNPLAIAVAAVCADADDYAAAFDRFFTGLQKVTMPPGLDPADRDVFVAAVRPLLAAYTSEFATGIPIAQTHQYAADSRRSKIVVIELLAAYEGWARHEVLRRRASEQK